MSRCYGWVVAKFGTADDGLRGTYYILWLLVVQEAADQKYGRQYLRLFAPDEHDSGWNGAFSGRA
jgi:hypothetical protein